MPIARLNNKNIYFSHIPKCGGTSVEEFLKTITGADLSFLDRNFNINTMAWNTSSPQHITGKDLEKLFSITFFDAFFTVTRHPFDRLHSAFIFQKYFVKSIAPETDINHFVAKLEDYQVLLSGRYDNHFLPQISFLYPGASYRFFKLEHGLDGLRKYIGSVFDVDVTNISMPHSKKQPMRPSLEINTLNEHSKKIIKVIYKLDFENFNY